MSDDFYHDDPIEVEPKRKLQRKFLTTATVLFASVLFFQSTFAGNISLNSGAGIEFGQAVSQTVACSGDTSLTATPNLLDVVNMHYYSSSEILWTNDAPFSREKGIFINHNQNNSGEAGSGRKDGDSNTRPVRAF